MSSLEITEEEIKTLNKKGHLHSVNDMPAVIDQDGVKEWWKNGLRHRDGDKPAIEKLNGSKEYWVNGLKHRDNDLPAIICIRDYITVGTHSATPIHGEQQQELLIWYKNGEIFRENNKPNKIQKMFGKDKEMKKELIAFSTINEWHNEFGLHRLDGPAVEADYISEYWINGIKLSKENFLLNKELNESLKNNTGKNLKIKI